MFRSLKLLTKPISEISSCPAASSLVFKLANLPPPDSLQPNQTSASTTTVSSASSPSSAIFLSLEQSSSSSNTTVSARSQTSTSAFVSISHAPTDPIPILAHTVDELAEEFVKLDIKKFRAKQVWKWLYCRGATAFAAMTDLPHNLRDKLQQHFSIGYGDIFSDQTSSDGTRKWGHRFARGADVESVFIPEPDRGTLCFSSQYGCSLQCSFCHTGTMDKKKLRNLRVDEIVAQIMSAKHALGDYERLNSAPATLGISASPHHVKQRLTNLVAMGMGEPAYNWKNVKRAMKIVMDPEGIALGKRRITISTSGVVPVIAEVGDELDVNLAISLHAVRDDLRDVLVPINKTFPLQMLMQACQHHVDLGSRRKVTFEYVMLAGVNDSDADADELARLVQSIPCMINLIPFNAWPGAPYTCSSEATILRFADRLIAKNLICCIRWPRGRDVLGACGQLATKNMEVLQPPPQEQLTRQRSTRISKE